ncbi:hypothetical protein NHX12_002475, partial [Muraenolepis orangiensis]
LLHDEWANYGVMHKYQPVDLIRKYFGEQIGLYFAWLGVYTQLLIPPSLLGIAVFVYGILTVDTNVPSQETCNDHLNITMCPLCNGRRTCLTTAPPSSLPCSCPCGDEEEELRHEYEAQLARPGNNTDGERDQMLSTQREPESLDIEDHLSGYLINLSTLLLLIGVTFSAVFGVAMYRICMLTVWSMNPDPEAKATFAVWLTELELPKTEAEFEERLIFKSFFLKSMNAFAPIFYVAFFKGRFAGRPGDYVYIFGDYRMEECAPPGCLIELCIQLSMIMLGKQLIQNNVFEVVIPKLKKMPKQQFDKDFALEPYEGISPEYMEMIIQYGFVSLFVASFPLAPAFALLNNVIEIRLDAAKFVSEIRRPDAVRCKDIGVRHLLHYMYSSDGTMAGYTEHSLAYFNVSHFEAGSAPTSTLTGGISMCRYKDYRDPPWASDAYTFSKQYWSVLAARLAFVIFFQNLAMFLSMLVAWLIPDVPRSLREQLKKENQMLKEFLLNEEGTAKPRSPQHAAPRCPVDIDILEIQEHVAEENGDGDGGGRPGEMEKVVVLEEGVSVAEDDTVVPGDDVAEEPHCSIDLDLFMAQLDDDYDGDGYGGGGGPSSRDVREMQLPRSDSKQQYPLLDPGLKKGSSNSLSGTTESTWALEPDPLLYSALGPQPKDASSSRGKARCSTLPSRPREGSQASYSYPRASHSTSLTKLQQMVSHIPLVPLGSPVELSQSDPFSPPLTRRSLTPTARAESPGARPESPKARLPFKLFTLRGPPPQEPRSRARSRWSTLPARQRGPGAEDRAVRSSQSTGFSQQGDLSVPSSPSELEGDSQL